MRHSSMSVILNLIHKFSVLQMQVGDLPERISTSADALYIPHSIQELISIFSRHAAYAILDEGCKSRPTQGHKMDSPYVRARLR